jgi:hypothetical protein
VIVGAVSVLLVKVCVALTVTRLTPSTASNPAEARDIVVSDALPSSMVVVAIDATPVTLSESSTVIPDA